MTDTTEIMPSDDLVTRVLSTARELALKGSEKEKENFRRALAFFENGGVDVSVFRLDNPYCPWKKLLDRGVDNPRLDNCVHCWGWGYYQIPGKKMKVCGNYEGYLKGRSQIATNQ